jgi:phosphoribosylglycinamide formyltransferase-1
MHGIQSVVRSGCRASRAGIDCGVRSHRSVRLAVFASGHGSNFEALANAAAHDGLGGSIVALLCDTPGAPVLERARRLGVEALLPPVGRFRTRLEDERPWLTALRERRVEAVLLAGFMRRLHAPLLEAFPGRILNIHPSLLPAFPGLDAIRQAWCHGVRVTGCTVHVVEAALDAGPIVAQAAVEVREGDTLASLEARVHAAEHALYPRAVRRWLVEPWGVEDGRLEFGRGAGLVLPEAEAAHG